MEAEPLVPPVVAVVVATGPGPWLADTLTSLGTQDYANLSVLVIDAGGGEDLTPSVAAVAPDAYVRRLDGPVSWTRAANEVLGIVDGASHFVFCHADVAADTDAIRQLVEEAFRSNAACVGPKLVAWSTPDRLAAVGFGADRLAVVHPLVEAGELDQEQHDSVRDVFVLPDAALLVRADLFAAIDGFDPSLEATAAALDLCWRIQLAGGRIVVAPSARFRHADADPADLAGRPSSEATERWRIRTLIACSGWSTLVWLLPLAVAVLGFEAAVMVLAGRPGDAGRRLAGLGDVVAHPQATWRARRRAQRHRQIPDRRLARLRTSGNVRLRAWARRRLEDPAPGSAGLRWARTGARRLATRTGSPEAGGDTPRVLADHAGIGPDAAPRAQSWRLTMAVTVGALAVFVLGSRSLFGSALPDVAGIPQTSAGVGALLHAWLTTWQPAGLGRVGPAPPALGLLALAGTALFGAVGTLQHVLVLGPLLLGPLGAWRAARWWRSPRARVATLVAYAVAPVGLGALAVGHWDGLVAYAAAPWVVGALIRWSDALPLPGTTGRNLAWRVGGLGLLVALSAAFVPSWLLVVPVSALGLAGGSLLVGQRPVAARLVALGVGAGTVAAVALLPWSVRAVTDPTTFLGPGAGAVARRSFASLLHLHADPMGLDVLGWGLVVAAALPLVIGRSWRLAWAARLWALILVDVAWTWAGLRGWLPVAHPEVMLAPAAFGLAASVGVGVVAFELDLPGYRFGWRQLASGVAALGLLAAAIPVVADAGGGRWNLPSQGAGAVFGAALPRPDQGGDYRVLWIGAPDALPLASVGFGPGQALATSFDGLPDVRDEWSSGAPGGAGTLGTDLRLAESGLTTRLGHLLAAAGVRYVVLPDAEAPANAGGPSEPTSTALADGLVLQTDLRLVNVDPDYVVYANDAWAPVRTTLPAGAAAASGSSGLAAARALGSLDLAGGDPVLQGGGSSLARGAAPSGSSIYVAATPSSHWQLRVGGVREPGRPAFGIGQVYTVAKGGPAELVAGTAMVWRLAELLMAVVWGLVLLGVATDRWRRAADGPVAEEWFTPLAPTGGRRARRNRAVRIAPKGMDSEELWIDA